MEDHASNVEIREKREAQGKLIPAPFRIKPDFIHPKSCMDQEEGVCQNPESTAKEGNELIIANEESCRKQTDVYPTYGTSLVKPFNLVPKNSSITTKNINQIISPPQMCAPPIYLRWVSPMANFSIADGLTPSCLPSGIITPQAKQRLSEQILSNEIKIRFLHQIHVENLIYQAEKAQLERKKGVCEKSTVDTEGNEIPLYKVKAELRKYEAQFIQERSVTKARSKYGGWQYMIRSTEIHRHVAVSEQEMTQEYYNFVFDNIPDSEEASDHDMAQSIRRLKASILPLNKSGLRVLGKMELMWENGVFNVKTLTFTPMNPSQQSKCFNIFSVELSYPEEFANPDGFDAVLRDMFGNDVTKIRLAYQIIGAILTPLPTRKKIFLFQGKSHGGKTRLASLIASLMPYEDVAYLNTLSEITDTNLVKTQCPIRMVNVAEVGKNKVPAKQIVSLKSFADGLSMPGMEAFKIVMSTNYKIVTGENGFLEPALKVRLLTLPFAKKMDNADPVVASYEDCAFEDEKAHIIIKALHAFREVLERNWTFCHEYPVNEVVENNSDTKQNNATAGLTAEEQDSVRNRNANSPHVPLPFEQLCNMRLVITEKVDSTTSLTTQQVMDDFNGIRPGILKSPEWTGAFLRQYYGGRLISKRVEKRGTCYNLAFATQENEEDGSGKE